MPRRGKPVPRLPLSAFTSASSDSFPVPPTPNLVSPRAVVDAHLRPDADRSSVVVRAEQSRVVLSVLVPFALDAPEVPAHLAETVNPTLTAVYDGATQVDNLRWALQHGRAVDLDIDRGITAIDAPAYDSLVNLLTKATAGSGPTPIVLTNVLPPPLDSLVPVVTMMNHPTYDTYRQRTSSLSLCENVCVKLLPPSWVTPESPAGLEEKELRNLLKLFIVPVLEAFGFDRIVFGSSPPSAHGSPSLAEFWYRLVLESFRELAVSQEEMDKIFSENALRIYDSTR